MNSVYVTLFPANEADTQLTTFEVRNGEPVDVANLVRGYIESGETVTFMTRRGDVRVFSFSGFRQANVSPDLKKTIFTVERSHMPEPTPVSLPATLAGA